MSDTSAGYLQTTMCNSRPSAQTAGTSPNCMQYCFLFPALLGHAFIISCCATYILLFKYSQFQSCPHRHESNLAWRIEYIHLEQMQCTHEDLAAILLLLKEHWSMVHACTMCRCDQSSSPEMLPCEVAGTTCVRHGLHTLRPGKPNSPHDHTETNTWDKDTNNHLTGVHLGQHARPHNRTRCSKAAAVL